jgi:hypothetical protein
MGRVVASMPQFYRARRRYPGFSLTPQGDIPTIGSMDSFRRWLPAVALALSPAVQATGDYVGVLRPTAKPSAIAIPEPGFYWPSTDLSAMQPGIDLAAEGFKLKLGYRYSRFFAVETGYAEFGSSVPRTPFSGFGTHGRGFSLDTVGTVPLWTNAALYGRIGAWRSDAGTSLLTVDTAQRPGAGLRYGLGLKYDLTRRVGFQAEMARYSPLDRWGTRESDTDQVTFGVTWRF